MSKDFEENNETKRCFVCFRDEASVDRLFRLPGGRTFMCADCMESSLRDMDGFYESHGVNPNSSDDLMNLLSSGNMFMGSPMFTQAQVTMDENSGEDGEASDEEGKPGKDNGIPNVSMINISDIGSLLGMGKRQPRKRTRDKSKPLFDFDKIPAPHKIKAQLDEHVVGQEQAKKIMSVAVYNHYKRLAAGFDEDIEIEKSNMLMIGPTGCGKTYMVKTLAKLLDVPLAITDATTLTEAGYIGDDIESVVSKLIDAADGDVDKAETGIIYIDEIDKLAKKQSTTTRDVNGEAVQQGLLKLLEGSLVEVPIGASNKNSMVPTATVDTSNILFICGGAFPNLEGIIKERLTKQSSIGFTADLKDKYDDEKNILQYVTVEDVRKYGMIPEFIGRLPIVYALTGMTEQMLVEVLKEPKNAIIKQYKKLLELDEVDLQFEEDALLAIAKKAKERETGARALRAVIEEIMLDIMYEIPKDNNIGRVIITKEYVEGTGAPKIEMRLTETKGEEDK